MDSLKLALAELRRERDRIDACIATIELYLDVPVPEPVRVPKRALFSRGKTGSVKSEVRSQKSEPSPGRGQNEARRDAIRKALRQNGGVARSTELLAKFPREEGHDDDQHRAAYRNTLHKMKVAGEIARTGDTWSFTGAGSSN